MVVSLATDDVFSAWRRNAILVGIGTLMLCSALLVLTWLLGRELHLRQRAERQLEALATTDPLTGLANRRKLDQTLEQEWRRAQRSGKPLSLIIQFYITIMRGTPLMLQIIVIYLGPGLMGFASPWGSSTNGRLLAAVVAFVINYACYFSEIYRGGIESVPVGQTEAGQVLGMTKSQIFFRVTLLQVIKRILAPMGNEVMTLIKDTSLANVIANKEIIMMAKEYSAKGLIWPLFSTALFFLVFVGAMTLLFNWLEKKLSYFR